MVALSAVLALLAARGPGEVRLLRAARLIVLMIVVQMVPLVALVIPIYLLLARFGQVNTLPGVIART